VNELNLLTVVAVIDDTNEYGLLRGQVGTIVEVLAPNRFEVEFSDNQGTTYAMAVMRGDQLMALHYEPHSA